MAGMDGVDERVNASAAAAAKVARLQLERELLRQRDASAEQLEHNRMLIVKAMQKYNEALLAERGFAVT